jgi:uncharacterized protein
MIIDLTEIEGAVQPFEFTIPLEKLELDHPTARLTGDARIKGDVARHAAQIEVNGSIDADAEVDCTRCLKPISSPLAIEFSVSFVAPEHFSSDKEHEVQVDDLDTDVLESDRIDVGAIAREQILLNLPEQVFCQADCKGLCPKCGADRNLIDCKCDETETDPRWAALKDFRF